MRILTALALPVLLLLFVLPQSAAAQNVSKFENKDLGIGFEYPSQWRLAPGEPRGILPNEVFNIRASADPTTVFTLAVYRLDAPVTDENLDATLDSLDQRFEAWVATLPGGQVLDIYEVTVDDVDGSEYEYEFELNGQLIAADTVILPKGDLAYEITQWARDDEYDDKADIFDEIFDSLLLPWTPSS